MPSPSEVSITRVEMPGLAEGQYVFQTNEEPPRFASIRTFDPPHPELDSDSQAFFLMDVEGPYCKEELDLSLQDGEYTPEQSEIRRELKRQHPYDVIVGEISIGGDYPGGREQAALNMARFVLALED